MTITVERTLSIHRGLTYQFFSNVFKGLIKDMADKVGHPIYSSDLKCVMNYPLYNEFFIACQTSGRDLDMYEGIKIIKDLTLYVNSSQDGFIRLVYEESGAKRYSRYYDFWADRSKEETEGYMDLIKQYVANDAKTTHELYYSSVRNYGCGHGFQRVPHIDHVKFNGPATIVFWKDGTKTVVKHDGKGRKDKRQAILYAFIRKIYGEGKPYHNILNEIEEAVK